MVWRSIKLYLQWNSDRHIYFFPLSYSCFLFLFVSFYILVPTYNGEHVFVSTCLVYFTQHILSNWVHFAANDGMSFFSYWINTSTTYIILYIIIHILYNICYIAVFIYSSDDGHLDGFQSLAIVSSATLNLVARCLLDSLCSFCSSGFGVFSHVWLLDHIASLLLDFKKSLQYFHIDCTNLHSHWQCTSHQHLLLCFCDFSHSDREEVVSHCDFKLHFPDD